MARTVSPPRTSRRSPPTQRHPPSSTPTTTTTTITTTSTTTASTNTTSTLNRTQTAQRPAERPNVPIAPASSNASSPIYSTTSSPPISPGISESPISSLGMMAPRSDSRSAALSMDIAPTSTPTGRISKAKKGKRVHACEYPGCGKIFTRAEHRRRHELNHNPDATYRCPQQGCGKSFHRQDLLQRHQERHDLEASTLPSSPNSRRYPSQPIPVPETSSAIPPTSMASPPVPQPAPRTSTGGMSILSMINGQQHAFHSMADSQAFSMNPYIPFYSSGDGWDAIYVSDHSHLSQPRAYHHSNMSSTESVASYDQSNGSPMIPASMPQTSWTQAPPPSTLPAMFDPENMTAYASSIPNTHPSPMWTETSGLTLDENYLYKGYYPVQIETGYPSL